MENALTNFLLGSNGITSLVGQRITWTSRPQASALPAIVLHKISSAPQYSDEGESGLFSSRVQVDCWAKDGNGTSGDTSARAVAAAVKARVSGLRQTSGGIEFQAIFVEDEQGTFEQGAGSEELYRYRVDLTIWHT